MKKVFISGKITGEPIDECFHKFAEACGYIYGLAKEDQIIEVVNPLWLPGIYFGISHKEAMEICLEALKDCTHIYMLKDWKESEGARIEHQFAKDNGIKIIYQKQTRIMKYLEERKGDLFVSKSVPLPTNGIVIVSYKVNKEELIENEDYEELIELQKMKHFSMAGALEFWDNFDVDLYAKILKAKNN